MAVYKVGDRVRIVGSFCENAKHLIGVETVILDIGNIGSPAGPVLGYGVAAGRTSMESYGFTADQLEPIIDDGRKVVSWSALKDLWQPTPEVETA